MGELELEEDDEARAAKGTAAAHARSCGQRLTTPHLRAQDVDGDDIRIDEFQGPLREWIAQAKVERQIKKRFSRFLNAYTLGPEENAVRVYPRKINELCASARPRSRRSARVTCG